MHTAEKILLVTATILILPLIGGGILLFNMPTTSITEKPSPLNTNTVAFNTIQPAPSTTPPITAPKVKGIATPQNFSADNFTFTYPNSWNPTKRTYSPIPSKETITLGIPDLHTDQEIGYSEVALDKLKPTDSIEETKITIATQVAYKWIRHGEGYFSYDYYTHDPKSDGSFGIHVTTSERDRDIESQLDQLASSISFK